jgi:hypothetical protein
MARERERETVGLQHQRPRRCTNGLSDAGKLETTLSESVSNWRTRISVEQGLRLPAMGWGCCDSSLGDGEIAGGGGARDHVPTACLRKPT